MKTPPYSPTSYATLSKPITKFGSGRVKGDKKSNKGSSNQSSGIGERHRKNRNFAFVGQGWFARTMDAIRHVNMETPPTRPGSRSGYNNSNTNLVLDANGSGYYHEAAPAPIEDHDLIDRQANQGLWHPQQFADIKRRNMNDQGSSQVSATSSKRVRGESPSDFLLSSSSKKPDKKVSPSRTMHRQSSTEEFDRMSDSQIAEEHRTAALRFKKAGRALEKRSSHESQSGSGYGAMDQNYSTGSADLASRLGEMNPFSSPYAPSSSFASYSPNPAEAGLGEYPARITPTYTQRTGTPDIKLPQHIPYPYSEEPGQKSLARSLKRSASQGTIGDQGIYFLMPNPLEPKKSDRLVTQRGNTGFTVRGAVDNRDARAIKKISDKFEDKSRYRDVQSRLEKAFSKSVPEIWQSLSDRKESENPKTREKAAAEKEKAAKKAERAAEKAKEARTEAAIVESMPAATRIAYDRSKTLEKRRVLSEHQQELEEAGIDKTKLFELSNAGNYEEITQLSLQALEAKHVREKEYFQVQKAANDRLKLEKDNRKRAEKKAQIRSMSPATEAKHAEYISEQSVSGDREAAKLLASHRRSISAIQWPVSGMFSAQEYTNKLNADDIEGAATILKQHLRK